LIVRAEYDVSVYEARFNDSEVGKFDSNHFGPANVTAISFPTRQEFPCEPMVFPYETNTPWCWCVYKYFWR
jgi:hypothetical protein